MTDDGRRMAGVPTIRLVRADDLHAFRDLRLDALQRSPEAFSADYELNVAQPDSWWQERLRAGRGGPEGAIYVADVGAELVGMAGVRRSDGPKMRHGAGIWGVYVRPAARGAGIADALLAACLGWARAQDIRVVRLAVVTSNAAAVQLYLRHGFTIYGVEPEVIFHGGVYHDELLMVRRITGGSGVAA